MALQTFLLHLPWEMVLKSEKGNFGSPPKKNWNSPMKQSSSKRNSLPPSRYWKEPENNPVGWGNDAESCLLTVYEAALCVFQTPSKLESVNPYNSLLCTKTST